MNAKGGFVLPSVVVLLSIMTLALWSAIMVLEGINRDLRQLQAHDTLLARGLSAEARLAFLIASEPLGSRGLRIHGRRISREEEFGLVRTEANYESERPIAEANFWFDNRPYRLALAEDGDGALPALVMRVQDEAGLLNFNTQSSEQIARYARAFGASEESAAAMADAAVDFIDTDDLRRLNGAEAPDYRRALRPAPADERLRNRRQILEVLGWNRLDRRTRRSVLETSAAASPTIPLNINTAPPVVLSAWFDLSEAQAQAVRGARESAALIGPRSVTQLTGKPVLIEDLRIYTFPANRLRVTFSLAGSNLRYQTWITLGDLTAEQPFFWAPIIVSDNFEGVTGGVGDEEVSEFPVVARIFGAGGRASNGFGAPARTGLP